MDVMNRHNLSDRPLLLRRRDFLANSAVGSFALLTGSASLPLALSGCGSDSPSAGPVPTPPGFSWADHPLDGRLFVDQNNAFSTTFDHSSRKHPGGATYFVDAVHGEDSNDGLSADRPLQSVAAACAQFDVGTVMVRGYGILAPYYRSIGFNNIVQGRHLNIIGFGDDIPYITTHDPLVFTATSSSTPNAYQSVRPHVSECMDMSAGAPGVRLTKVAGVVECAALPGSWAQTDFILYVHAPDSRDLGTTDAHLVWALLSVPNFKNVGDYTSYLANIALYGGVDCVNASGGTSAGGALTLIDVETSVSESFVGNNVSAWGVDSVLVNCRSTRSGQDGFNYHALNGKSPTAIEINCVATECGHSASDQCTTAHDGAKIIRVGGTYRDATAANVADINGTAASTESWNLGCQAVGAGDGYANWQCGAPQDTGAPPRMWLDACDSGNAEFSTTVYGDGRILSRDSHLERNRSEVKAY